jgi:hypothetical protein
MTPLVELTLCLFHKTLVRCAALLVPGAVRLDWLREWRAEMWHVRRACGGEAELTAFCLGAFQDAWCLRRQAWREWMRGAALHESAGQCLLAMAAVLAACCALAHLLPEVRSATNLLWYPARTGLVLIQKADAKAGKTAIPFEEYRMWSGRKQRYFDAFAFYRMSQENVLEGQALEGGWKIAYATPNLFSLLGIPVQLESSSSETNDKMPAAVVSDAMWRRAFGSDPEIAGRVLLVDGREVRVVGVAASRAWKLPGHPDAWVLEPEAAMSSNPAGHVAAHLTRDGRAAMWAGRVHITAYGRNNSELDLDGTSIDEETVRPWDLYRFALFLALLALPAITTVSLGEYSPSSHRPPWPRRVVRWLYLAAKIALLLPIVYFASLDLAYWRLLGSSHAAEYIQLFSGFAICLAGMRWALLDQRQRCPVCLKRVAHPAQVGLASRTFLAWNGTELMCTGGHTLLHVPGLPTSWFATQQWLYLDASWEFLFAGPEAG